MLNASIVLIGTVVKSYIVAEFERILTGPKIQPIIGSCPRVLYLWPPIASYGTLTDRAFFKSVGTTFWTSVSPSLASLNLNLSLGSKYHLAHCISRR